MKLPAWMIAYGRGWVYVMGRPWEIKIQAGAAAMAASLNLPVTAPAI